ncbi:MAG TPA: hypothetical protein PLY88_07645 [Candidatus Omnitrophota bacterium]|nr:hypothetical protein [Candidatus Omnitrophota bacterium]
MKILKVLLLISLAILLLATAVVGYCWKNRVPLLEKAMNQAIRELFEGTLRLKSVDIKNGKLLIQGIEGVMTMDTRQVPIQIEKLETETPLWETLLTRRSEIRFHGFRPKNADQSTPISGSLRLRGNETQSASLRAQISRVWIEDYAWIDPVSFNGLRGYVSGNIRIRIDSNEKAKFEIDLKSEPEGGEVPARFLEFALPYLPKAQNTKDLRDRIKKVEGVKFVNSIISAKTTEPGKIQAEMKMLFPEININLNLNLTILVDEEHAFLRAFKLLGLFKIQAGAK